jgi:hypothetical protein
MTNLAAISKQYYRERYPNVPEHCLPRPKYTGTPANKLTKQIIDFIKFSGGMAERVNSMGIYDAKLGKYRPSGSRTGTADISATFQGRSIKIEVKIGRDRLSPAQKKYADEVTKAGGLYYVANNYADFEKWFNDLFNKKKAATSNVR